MKIYTRTGDTGQTGLFGGGRVAKDDARVAAYGDVDELNAALGVARAAGLGNLDAWCQDLQDQLFTVGAVLATPRGTRADAHIPHVRQEWVAAMEQRIDALQQELPPQTHFVLPGGTPASAALHLVRTVCRRAERSVVPLFREGLVDEVTMQFLNRLSDFLFVLARAANHRAGVKDVPWIPAGTPSP
ncbi:MAG TPA: cob(I)yrinic acid a,c-diamide adenosyltransferase [Myxococcaceae bacterium]|nr:cob(I)yrinic acid a,c-diamide adenosyltransferase [Myxococcaceae bacterium]